jgi:hypothetical protein
MTPEPPPAPLPAPPGPVRVGMFPPAGLAEQDPESTRRLLAVIGAAGVDFVCAAIAGVARVRQLLAGA